MARRPVEIQTLGEMLVAGQRQQPANFRRLRMQGLVSIGVLLVIAWVVAFVVFKVAGFLIHLLLIVGAIMLVVGLARRMSSRL
jgi:cobalamin biosynthesis protein CobD/CbiB